jgi:hypothetical protein
VPNDVEAAWRPAPGAGPVPWLPAVVPDAAPLPQALRVRTEAAARPASGTSFMISSPPCVVMEKYDDATPRRSVVRL